ncbi:MAG TPA: acyl-CoA dehydrogenase [Alphaproteobacteria bacterium]|nr:acyl-CoA dehydrogenase [Alphaproteobacteria bacterium]
MTDYAPPLADLRFALTHLAGLERVLALPCFEDVTPDLVDAVLDEADKFAQGVLAPLSRIGDQQGARLENGVVRMPDGFPEAYKAYVEGGWNGPPFPPEHGGQGLPWLVATALNEIWGSANLGFSLGPLLTQGAVELLEAHGSAEQKASYLQNMVTGRWSGTMNLTEPQAGSDVGALRTKAVRENGHYRISGQKIYISYGDHEMAENIVHLVLARTEDAPPGIKGISLFIVPKYLVNEDGSPGARNDLRAASLEHKMGIHASPTAVMLYGENEGAVGYLVGEECRGIEYMFTMMNNARLGVGLQGVSVAERAYQQAVAFAKDRVQMRDAVKGGREPVTIIHHPDVRRMLLRMRAQTEAMRALALTAGAGLDLAKHLIDPDQRQAAQRRVDLLIPVVKAWSTDLGVEVASTNVQVHGGMGYIEETGAAQHYRDARIAAIYEGTNGIQAIDLVGRKVGRDGGEAMGALIAEMTATAEELRHYDEPDLIAIVEPLAEGLAALERASRWMVSNMGEKPGEALAGASSYLRMAGYVIGGWLMARGAMATAGRDDAFAVQKRQVARFFAEQLIPEGTAMERPIVSGGALVATMSPEAF